MTFRLKKQYMTEKLRLMCTNFTQKAILRQYVPMNINECSSMGMWVHDYSILKGVLIYIYICTSICMVWVNTTKPTRKWMAFQSAFSIKACLLGCKHWGSIHSNRGNQHSSTGMRWCLLLALKMLVCHLVISSNTETLVVQNCTGLQRFTTRETITHPLFLKCIIIGINLHYLD